MVTSSEHSTTGGQDYAAVLKFVRREVSGIGAEGRVSCRIVVVCIAMYQPSGGAKLYNMRLSLR